MSKVSKPVSHDELTPTKLRDMIALRERGSVGEWRIETALMGKDYYISTSMRDRDIAGLDGDGPIAFVSGERTVSRHSTYSDETTYSKRQIKTARDDADLIVHAVNILKPLCEALLRGEQLDETAWLIEWPADKHMPLRYYGGGGEPPVLSANDALRFCRKQDAERLAKDMKLMRGYQITEHKWVNARLIVDPIP